MKITLENYQEAVSKFCSKLPLPQHNSHMTLGIIEEFHEVDAAINADDRPNAVEEFGDLSWYMSQYCRENGLSFAKLTQELLSSWSEMGKQSTPLDLVNITKKELAYGKTPSQEDRIDAIAKCIHCWLLGMEMVTFRLTIAEILQINYNKLDARYHGRPFSAKAALNRDLAKERKILEEA